MVRIWMCFIGLKFLFIFIGELSLLFTNENNLCCWNGVGRKRRPGGNSGRLEKQLEPLEHIGGAVVEIPSSQKHPGVRCAWNLAGTAAS